MLQLTIMAARKNDKIDNNGQAIFEFLIFLPFFIFVFTLLITFGNAINGSINQQKATRRYTFYLIKGNSTFPANDSLVEMAERGLIGQKGDISIGWREKSKDDSSFGTCYKINSIFNDSGEECDEKASGEATSFVRIFTVFGICGQSYVTENNIEWQPRFRDMGRNVCGQR